jgi:decaprenylphospho-beta-D-ribofuranose 2-oxidase
MSFPGTPTHLTNWSMTAHSPCYVATARDSADILAALATARANGRSVIAHGAGHSYSDAALNGDGMVVDMTGMRRIVAWDPERGIMQVEPGVTMREVVRVALPDGWWPPVTPSTAEATIGGCVAMNVMGKNAWHCGSFGEHVLSLTVLLVSGQSLTVSPASHPHLFHALVGSAGLLGIITSITLQLRRVASGNVLVRTRAASSINDILAIFQEEQTADFAEAWVDGIAHGRQLGRGIVTCATYSDADDPPSLQLPADRLASSFAERLARWSGSALRPVLQSGTRLANGIAYQWATWQPREAARPQSLFHSTFYHPVAFAGLHALFPHGTETLQVFVPHAHAEALFTEILRCSHANQFLPLWCIIKRHRSDPFLLSYQVDGFSLEVNYRLVPHTRDRLHQMLREMIDLVIAAGGRLYLAKDALLTQDRLRQSVGDAAIETFLALKRQYDPDMLLQSDLFRRLFQLACESARTGKMVQHQIR